jgi:hypothetical protein
MRPRLQIVGSAAAAALLLALTGCPKHEDFPTELSFVKASVPTDFVINSLGLDANDEYMYNLTWTNPDPSVVARNRLYLVEGGLVPELLAEPTGGQYDFTLPVNAVGLHFGLSAVSTDLVESSMTIQVVPPVAP